MGVDDRQNSGPVSARNLLSHHNAHPLALRVFLNRRYGQDWVDWDPDALWVQLERDHGINVSELSKTKVQAVRTLETDYRFWTEWEIFYPICKGLNNRIPNFWLIQKPTVPQLYAATDMASAVRSRPYSEEVKKYMAACFLDAGVVYAPPPLDFIQEEIDGLRYRCQNCSNDAEDDGNRECDDCGSADIRRYRQRDSGKIGSKIQSLLEKGYDRLDEDVVGIQTARLTVALDYMMARRKQLEQQLELMGADHA